MLVLSPRRFNAATGMAVVCPPTGTARGWAFEVVLPAEGLGVPPVAFPGGQGGFLGGEYGQMGAPEAFAAKLREVLAG